MLYPQNHGCGRRVVRLGFAVWSAAVLVLASAYAETIFLEAESFDSPTDGWRITSDRSARQASGMAMLSGFGGAQSGTATAKVTLAEAGHYRVWARYTSHPTYRGPFRVAALRDGRELGGQVFDSGFEGKTKRDD